MKTWAVRVTVELLQDDVVVATRRQTVGSKVEHVAMERRYVQTLAATMARTAARVGADELGLLK